MGDEKLIRYFSQEPVKEIMEIKDREDADFNIIELSGYLFVFFNRSKRALGMSIFLSCVRRLRNESEINLPGSAGVSPAFLLRAGRPRSRIEQNGQVI